MPDEDESDGAAAPGVGPVRLDRIEDIADRFDAMVFDQWGVLHDGAAPYDGVPDALLSLAGRGHRLAVLSNSGKRSSPNAARIAALGYADVPFEAVMTSGEAFWRDVADGVCAPGAVLPIVASVGDAETWALGLDMTFARTVSDADAILLMGLPEGSDGAPEAGIMDGAAARNLPVYCTNPDRKSPRPGGGLQVAPGALAHAYQDRGGPVTFYGKPHGAIFETLARTLGVAPERTAMVGDSLEHDIAGGAAAGWTTIFITGGLEQGRLSSPQAIAAQAGKLGTAIPDFFMQTVR